MTLMGMVRIEPVWYCMDEQYPTEAPTPQAFLRTGRARRRMAAGVAGTGAHWEPAMHAKRPDLSQTRIVKRLAPHQPGTKKLSERFGDTLVCVRYRQDLEQARRYTTVELLVDEGPMVLRPAQSPRETVLVRLKPFETQTRLAACAMGAQWDQQLGAWRMSRRAAGRLNLIDRALPAPPSLDNSNGKL